ncbi:MAG: MBL fold metallo-hydrolase [candidate division WOR-3 bacterium]
MRITIVYDNRSLKQNLVPDWGFACVVEVPGYRLLFDTGAKGELLQANMTGLGITLAMIEAVVISHDHWDHTGGLKAVLKQTRTPCYLPASATRLSAAITAAGSTCVPVTSRTQLWPRVWSTGELGDTIKEQSLVVESNKGVVLITGCAHPGILEISRQVSLDFGRSPCLVLGGFHLGQTSPQEVEGLIRTIRALGIARIGPAHCTGEEATGLFQREWADGFELISCGRVLELEAR